MAEDAVASGASVMQYRLVGSRGAAAGPDAQPAMQRFLGLMKWMVLASPATGKFGATKTFFIFYVFMLLCPVC